MSATRNSVAMRSPRSLEQQGEACVARRASACLPQHGVAFVPLKVASLRCSRH